MDPGENCALDGPREASPQGGHVFSLMFGRLTCMMGCAVGFGEQGNDGPTNVYGGNPEEEFHFRGTQDFHVSFQLQQSIEPWMVAL
jgi:hypothetical protein